MTKEQLQALIKEKAKESQPSTNVITKTIENEVGFTPRQLAYIKGAHLLAPAFLAALEALEYYASHPPIIAEALYGRSCETFIHHKSREALAEINKMLSLNGVEQTNVQMEKNK